MKHIGGKHMQKIKVLVIAPYEGLRDLIDDLAHERNEIDVHCFISDMHDGLLLAKELEHENYDVILSRAGTAELIRKESILPVIDIKLSVLDMMRAIKLAQGYSGKFAIVGYNTITNIAKQICELLQYDIIIKTIYNTTEIDKALLELRDCGISLIVGDVITTTHAKRLGLNTTLITTGKESIINAFNEVVILYNSFKKDKDRNTIIKSILENSNSLVICFNENDSIVYSNIKKYIRDFNSLILDLKNYKQSLIKNLNLKILKTYGETIFSIKGVLIEFNNERYLTYYIENQSNTIKVFNKAIRFINVDDSPQVNIDTFNSSSEVFQNLINTTKSYAHLKTPIIIIGERGTGKDTIAYTIYRNGMNNKNPLIIIDARYISEEKWIELFESEKSLFLNIDFTIYIKNIHHLDKSSQKILESYLLDTDVHRRNRLIFSMVNGISETFDNSSLLYFIKNRMHALPLTVPNLNQRREDIPNLVSLYLSELNLSYGKQVIGLEDDAVKLLQEFNWKNNIDQLRRVIRQLIMLTETSYIKYDTVKKVLQDETPSSTVSKIYNINLNNTLDKITKDIIDIVLKEENYNQSKASKRLGISRSTLWRKIK